MSYKLNSQNVRELLIILFLAFGSVVGVVTTLNEPRTSPNTTNTSATSSSTKSTPGDQSGQSDVPMPKSAPCTAKQQTTRTGWKTCCDTFYHYCFDYPESWAITDISEFNGYCGPNTVVVTSPSGDVNIRYVNENSRDNGFSPYYPVQLVSPSPTDQSLSVIGGYTVGEKAPEYQAIDTSTVTELHPTVGRVAKFPDIATFTDRGSGSYQCIGSFSTYPAASSYTAAQARAWFGSTDAKTALLILETLRYAP